MPMLAQRTGSQRTFYAARGVTGSEELFGIKLEEPVGFEPTVRVR